MKPDPPEKPAALLFAGVVVAVKARIRLCRSFDQVSHQYQGYTLILRGTIGGKNREEIRIAVGPAAHKKHQFRIGDQLSGKTHPVLDPRAEWAQYYRTSGVKVAARGSEEHDRPADPDGGICPPLEDYRERGHVRLAKRTCETRCRLCPFGLTMATEITIDHWNPTRKKWRFETHCYGPRNCRRYRPGPPRRVPGRKPGMIWTDRDIEREEDEAATTSIEPLPVMSEGNIEIATRRALDALGGQVEQMLRDSGVDPTDMVRFMLLGHECQRAREADSLTVKEAAKLLGCPQYRLEAIEEASLAKADPAVTRDYVQLLGVDAFFEEWCDRFPDLARRFQIAGD